MKESKLRREIETDVRSPYRAPAGKRASQALEHCQDGRFDPPVRKDPRARGCCRHRVSNCITQSGPRCRKTGGSSMFPRECWRGVDPFDAPAVVSNHTLGDLRTHGSTPHRRAWFRHPGRWRPGPKARGTPPIATMTATAFPTDMTATPMVTACRIAVRAGPETRQNQKREMSS